MWPIRRALRSGLEATVPATRSEGGEAREQQRQAQVAQQQHEDQEAEAEAQERDALAGHRDRDRKQHDQADHEREAPAALPGGGQREREAERRKAGLGEERAGHLVAERAGQALGLVAVAEEVAAGRELQQRIEADEGDHRAQHQQAASRRVARSTSSQCCRAAPNSTKRPNGRARL